MKGAKLILEAVEIDAALGPDAAIGHRKQSSRNKKPFKSAIINMRRKSDDVLNDASPDSNNDALFIAVVLLEKSQSARDSVEGFLFLAGRYGESRQGAS